MDILVRQAIDALYEAGADEAFWRLLLEPEVADQVVGLVKSGEIGNAINAMHLLSERGRIAFQSRGDMCAITERPRFRVRHHSTLQEALNVGEYELVDRELYTGFEYIPEEEPPELALVPVEAESDLMSVKEILVWSAFRFTQATLADLLAVGCAYPQVQEEFFVLAFGSTKIHNDVLLVPALTHYIDVRAVRTVPIGTRLDRERVRVLVRAPQ